MKNISDLIQDIKSKKISVSEIVKNKLDIIEKKEKDIEAFLYIDKNEVLKKAKELDNTKNKEGKLFGIPISIKDIICTKSIPTTAGSKMLQNYKPPYNATVIEKLEKENYIMIGKTNLDEFAMGASGETSAYKITKNPLDITKIPGGSSSGSIASVSADMCYGSLGTDTGGSIRQPSAMCGTVGLKPSYGRVSRYGAIPLGSSLDQIGPIAKNVRDCALLLEIIAGQDKSDQTTLDIKVPNYEKSLNKNLKGKTVGIPKEYLEKLKDEGLLNIIEKLKKLLISNGIKIKEISLPHTKYSVPVYYIIMASEVSTNLAKFDGLRYGPDINIEEIYTKCRTKYFGDEVKRRILLGTFSLSEGFKDEFYHKASKVRTLIKQDFDNAFKDVDILLTPTTPERAWNIGEKIDDPIKMYLADIFTCPVNLAGICGLNIPIFEKDETLPYGIQLLGNRFCEQEILNFGYLIESEIK